MAILAAHQVAIWLERCISVDGDPGGRSTRLRGVRVTLDGNTGKECCTIQNVSRRCRSQLISQFVRSVSGAISFKYCFITPKWGKKKKK